MHGTNHLGVNLAFTKFIFITPSRDDDAALMRVRSAGGIVARGFFNDFESEGSREPVPHETIQFLVSDNGHGRADLSGARYAVQVSSKYRPRLQDTECELRRRLGDNASIVSLDGAIRTPQYTSAQMHAFAYKDALHRTSGRTQRNVVIIPMSKTEDWWRKSALERHAYFYPHVDQATGQSVKGHAKAAEAGIATVSRRLYYNPDGVGRPNEYDFIACFELADEHLDTFDGVCRALRDAQQNPEWRFVVEGPEWRGRRVLKW